MWIWHLPLLHRAQGGPVPGGPSPDGALISDDDDSFISHDTESEGDFGGGDNADDDDV